MLKEHVGACREALSGAIVLETHLDRQQSEDEEDYWIRRGWHVQFAPGQYDDGMWMDAHGAPEVGGTARARGVP